MSNRKGEIDANLADVNFRIEKAAKSAGRSVDEITLVAVTKTFPVSDIEFLYQLVIKKVRLRLHNYQMIASGIFKDRSRAIN